MLKVHDGTASLRPAIDGPGRAIYDGLDQVDMFTVYREVRCPILFVNVEPLDDASAPRAGPPWISELMRLFERASPTSRSASIRRPGAIIRRRARLGGLLSDYSATPTAA
jgi:hypothetical protein